MKRKLSSRIRKFQLRKKLLMLKSRNRLMLKSMLLRLVLMPNFMKEQRLLKLKRLSVSAQLKQILFLFRKKLKLKSMSRKKLLKL